MNVYKFLALNSLEQTKDILKININYILEFHLIT